VNDTLWNRWTVGVARVRQRPDWAEFAGVDWADTIMDRSASDRFHAKQGRSIGRLTLHHDNRRLTVYLKRHYRLPWWRGLLATIWPGNGWSPGLEEWHNITRARELGLPVGEAVAAGEIVGPHGRLQSFLAVEELAGMAPLHEAIPAAARTLSPGAFRRWKAGLVDEMIRLVRALHDRRYFHKDLYLCHFYIPVADTTRAPDRSAWRGRIHVIDFHRLGRHPVTCRFWQVKDLAQLLYSSEVEGVDDRDRLRFWRAYLGGHRRTIVHRWLGWAIRLKWRRYRRHNQKGRRAAAPGAAA
jgi:heptose I phosphotransferase